MWMAKQSKAMTVSRATFPAGGGRSQSITVKVPRPRAAPTHHKKTKHHRRHGGGDGSFTNVVVTPGIAGLILGYIDKGSLPFTVPTIPMLGRAGTLALAAWWFRKHHRMLPRLAGGFAAIALYEWEREGSIAGLAY